MKVGWVEPESQITFCALLRTDFSLNIEFGGNSPLQEQVSNILFQAIILPPAICVLVHGTKAKGKTIV